MRPGESRVTRRELIALAVACAAFVVVAWLQARHVTHPYYDDADYLEIGYRIRAAGSPLKLWPDLFAGRFREATRHPLYLGLLAFLARPDYGYFRASQALNVALGVVALLACWWAARRHFGRGAAVAAVLLLGTGKALVESAVHPWCEPLLLVWWALAVGAVLDGAAADDGRGRRAWALAGAFSGLAYLTKPTGIFLPVSVALALLAWRRLRAALDGRAWAYAAGFVVAASPLLVRNVRVYGAPLHNENSRTLWIDRLPDYAELFAPHALDRLPAGFAEYVQRLTPGSLAWRLATAVGETSFILVDAAAPVVAAPGGPLHVAGVVLALVAVVIGLRTLWRWPAGLARTFLLVHAGWTYAFLFLFNAHGGNTRHFLPLAATVVLPAFGAFLVEDARRAGGVVRSRWARTTAVLAGSYLAASIALTLRPPSPPPGLAEVERWLAAHLRPGEVYAVDARTHLSPNWLLPDARKLIVSPTWEQRPVGAEAVLDYLREQRVRFVVLDAESSAFLGASGDPGDRRYLFYDALPLEPDRSLPLGPFPGGLVPVYVDPARPRRWIVLETRWAADVTVAPRSSR